MFLIGRKWNRRCKILFWGIGAVFFMISSLTAKAADAKVLSTIVNDGNVYVFIRGVSELGADSTVQIGDTLCQKEQISSGTLGSSGISMRTLVLVDNSKSIPAKNHANIQEILEGIVSSSLENEEIKIGTFSNQVFYLCEYSSNKEILNNVIRTITYNDQNTYLSDVLYDAIKELNAENACAYTRIFVIADGADDNPNGRINDEVRSYIRENTYPVYSVGIPGKNNSSELETMFSFSRAAETEYFLLDGSISNAEIINVLTEDQSSICLKIALSESVKDGSMKNILLKLSTQEGVIELETSAKMPFGSGVSEEPAEDDSDLKEEDDSEENNLMTLRPEEAGENTVEEKTKTFPWMLLLIIAAAILLAVVITVVIVLRKKAKKKVLVSEEKKAKTSAFEEFDSSMRDTVMAGDIMNDRAKPLWNASDTYLKLSCVDDTNVMFKEKITDVIRIGRQSNQDIVIDDGKLSKMHCEIRLRGDLLYIKDCHSTNGTKYEGVSVYDKETPVVNGGKIEIGAHRYRVELIKE